ncbi:hypothetical protein M5D96_011177 [Drosophila gunungcola]|uniref:C-type lectin domain-containing protein n=1 Tax=Drosophila gunungcola TaxID=103775 RepID=A0A9P9YGC7_9MUSC|nr:hypothetical protein M5D96_011177 [Drosophila gunungcola]
MLKLTSHIICFFIILDLLGSLAHSQGHRVCLLQDAPNQCGAFCLAALRPVYDHNSKMQAELEGLKKSITKEGLEERLKQTERHIMEAKSEMKKIMQFMDIKMDSKFGEVEKKLQDQTKIEALLKTLETKMAAFQATLLKTLSKTSSKCVPPLFEKIGTRYFYIEKENELSWTAAAAQCREMGGYLASIKSQKELEALQAKLNKQWFWLGINDRETNGNFVSEASGKPSTVFKWRKGYPKDGNPCVLLGFADMIDWDCADKSFYICQADNET